MKRSIAQYHLPGLFEFYELYKVFLPLFREHREYFMIGVILDLSMVPQWIVSGAEDEQDLGMTMQGKC